MPGLARARRSVRMTARPVRGSSKLVQGSGETAPPGGGLGKGGEQSNQRGARKLYRFHGGIHPPENKRQSLEFPIRRAEIPAELILPLSQHIGAPAKPLVEAGQEVLKGELIAEAAGPVSAPVHASTSGRVVAIEARPVAHPSGLTAPCIVLESDGREEWAEPIKANGGVDCGAALRPEAAQSIEAIKGWLEAFARSAPSPRDLTRRIQEAGIAGLGGAGFPTAVKLNPAEVIQTLVINGAECEPYITADDILMRERAGEVLAGSLILRRILRAEDVLLGIEDNKPAAIAALREAAATLREGAPRGTGATDIEITVIPTQYPSGGEKQLIEILTGKQVPSGGLPGDIGVACQNVGTCVAVFRAICYGEPLLSRITTLTGGALTRPRNFEALLGTPVRCLLEQANYDAERGNRLIMGGPMMGFTLDTPDVPVVKTTNCILAPTAEELPAPKPAQPCIRCGLCAEVCPASLLPQQLYWFAQSREYDKLERHNLFDCIECGACSWVCPSDIPLVQYYRAAKAEVSQLRRDQAKAEHSKARFEAHQQRVEREAAAREAQRAARREAAAARAAAAAAGGDAAADPVQAAIERAQAKKAAQADSS